MSAAPKLDPKKRRLVLALYRSMMRWCQDLHPSTPLNHHVPPMQGGPVANVKMFQMIVRDEFRTESSEPLNERTQRAIDGLKKLNQIRPDLLKHSLQWGEKIAKHQEQKARESPEQFSDNSKQESTTYSETSWVKEQIDAIRWLPELTEFEPKPLVNPYQEEFPMFPLKGPLLDQDTLLADTPSDSLALPLFTSPQDIPVPGMEIPLQIFEPRYRELYDDLQTSGNRRIVVPFAHPFVPNQFARYALIHQLTNLKEIADETNGKIQYLADHVVTRPVYIDTVLNPQVGITRETYLRVQGKTIEDDDALHDVWEPLFDVLTSWKNETSHPLATKSLTALESEGLWGFVHVWNMHFQQELLHLQLGIATQVKSQAGIRSDFTVGMGLDDARVSVQTITTAQEPHRRRLLQLMMDTSLMVPTLLSLDGIGKCQHLFHIVEREWHFQKNNSFSV